MRKLFACAFIVWWKEEKEELEEKYEENLKTFRDPYLRDC